MDDDGLIAALAGGDDTALRELFTRHAPWLAARLRKALPPEDVEDVLQETFLSGITGTPPVYEFTAGLDWTSPAGTNSADWRAGVQEDFLDTVIGGSAWKAGYLGPAQQAVVNALMTAVGSSSQAAFGGFSVTPQVAAAARRFAALSPSARHAWLAAHLQAVESGQVTLGELP